MTRDGPDLSRVQRLVAVTDPDEALLDAAVRQGIRVESVPVERLVEVVGERAGRP